MVEGQCSHNQAGLFPCLWRWGELGEGLLSKRGFVWDRSFSSSLSAVKFLADFLDQLFVRQAVEAVD